MDLRCVLQGSGAWFVACEIVVACEFACLQGGTELHVQDWLNDIIKNQFQSAAPRTVPWDTCSPRVDMLECGPEAIVVTVYG